MKQHYTMNQLELDNALVLRNVIKIVEEHLENDRRHVLKH